MVWLQFYRLREDPKMVRNIWIVLRQSYFTAIDRAIILNQLIKAKKSESFMMTITNSPSFKID